MTKPTPTPKEAKIRERYRGLQGDMPPFGDVITLLRILDWERAAAQRARAEALAEAGEVAERYGDTELRDAILALLSDTPFPTED